MSVTRRQDRVLADFAGYPTAVIENTMAYQAAALGDALEELWLTVVAEARRLFRVFPWMR